MPKNTTKRYKSYNNTSSWFPHFEEKKRAKKVSLTIPNRFSMINLTKSIHYIFRVNLNDPVDVRIFQNQFWNWGVYISSNFDWSVLVVDRALDFSYHWRFQFGVEIVEIKQLKVCTIPSSNDGFETLSTISKPWNEKKKLLCGSLFGSISCEEEIGMFENITKRIFYIKILETQIFYISFK